MDYREGRVLWYNKNLDFGSVFSKDSFLDDRPYYFKKNNLLYLEELPEFVSELEVSFEVSGDYAINLKCLKK